MVIATEAIVEIPAYEIDGRVIIPAFKVSSDIANWGTRALDAYKEAPTLAQLRYADSANDVIRENIRSHRYRGEWTADFVNYNVAKPKGKVLPKGFIYAELVQRPESVREEDGVWIAEGGKRIGIELPANGYQVPDEALYNPETGFPVLTVDSRENAVKALSNVMSVEAAEKEVSYFWRWEENHERLSPVSRRYSWPDEHGPVDVDAYGASPLDSSSAVGSRVVRSLVEKTYALNEQKYRQVVEGLEALKEGNVTLSDMTHFTDRILGILYEAELREEKQE